jgi:hypothetical protein
VRLPPEPLNKRLPQQFYRVVDKTATDAFEQTGNHAEETPTKSTHVNERHEQEAEHEHGGC